MEPYYQDEGGITLWLADCRDVLPVLPPASVDLLLTDPPYGVEWQSNMRAVKFALIAGDDGTLAVSTVLRLALRAVKGRRHAYIFGRWDTAVLGLGGGCELVWDKTFMSGGDLSLPWGKSHEYITFGVNNEAAQRRLGGGNVSAKLRRGTVLQYPRPCGSAVTRHPTEKPVPLLRELIECSTRFNDVVLDPFAGVGSTLVAARLECRRALGIEIEERYCEIAARRLSQCILPFEPEAASDSEQMTLQPEET